MKKILLPGLFILFFLLNFKGYSQTTTLSYTGTVQTYTVPAGVTLIAIDARGGMGGGVECAHGDYQSVGGCGGRVQATINVTPGHVLNVTVGNVGSNTGPGGYGGGGTDPGTLYSATWPGAGGAGGTTITDATTGITLVVAGGGGGGGGDFCTAYAGGHGDQGGAGGGQTGAAGNADACTVGGGGKGGTPTAGGAGSACGGTGGTGTAGTGASVPATAVYGSGGGGGGWWGGGSGSDGSGGGGGSSYVNPAYFTVAADTVHTQGYNCTVGEAIITVLCSAGTITGPTSVCVGSTINLTDATSGGTWSSSSAHATIGTSGIVSGITTGTATITYTVPAGCYATYVVTVQPLPVAITGTMNVCVGLTTALTDVSGTGTWVSSTTSIAIVGSLTGIVTGESGGTSNITYTITSTGCYTVTPVTVNPTPAAITGTLTVCAGSTTSLTDATIGGTWSSTGDAAVDGSGNVTGGASAGTATVTYMLSTGCIQTVVVTVNTQPVAITDNTPVCQTFTITLSDGTSGGLWTSVTTTVATVTAGGGIVTGVGVGTSTISYAIGSCYVTTTVTVNTQPTAILGSFSLCEGASTLLTDATGGGTWGSSTTSVAGIGTDGTVTASTTITGTTTITYEIGSCYVTQVVTVTPQPVAISGNTGSICEGATLSLSDTPLGGVWSSVTTTVATISGGGLVTASTTTTGTSTISYTIGSCYATTIVTVATQPGAILGSFSLCEGASTLLSDATGGGTWGSSTTSVAGIGTDGTVTASTTVTGTTTITYEIGSCYVTQVVTVTPQPAAISGNTHVICEGATLSLSDAPSGGVWSSVTTTVATISGGGLVTASTTTTGTSTISYTIGSCYATTVVTVVTQPSAISGSFSLCEGSSTLLTDAVGGGTWSSTVSGVAGIGTDGTVTASTTTTGTTTISYIIGTCYVTQVVTVTPQPAGITGNTGAICEGSTLQLTDATSGGGWSSVTTTVATISGTGLVTASTTTIGTSVISYTIGACASTTIVTVVTQPAAISGTFSLCEGSTTLLTDATSGGTWSSTVTGVAGIGTDGTVTASSTTTGTTTISYILGTCYVTRVVTVTTQPAAITGNTGPVCEGSTLQLTDATSGGAWSSVTTTVATVSGTGLVTASTTTIGTSVISYTIGACASTTIVTVVTQPASISGTLSVCQGLTTDLTDATGSGTWSSVSGSIGTISTTGIVTGISAGTTVISYTLGSCVSTAIVTVDPLPLAITGTLSVCAGATTGLHDGTGGGTWSSSNTTIASIGSTTGVVTGGITVIVTSTATITYTINTGCIITAVVTVNPLPTGILGGTAVCYGSTVTLSDATGGGTWSSSNTTIVLIGSSTGIATGENVGSATITYTLPTGCYITELMTVDPLPSAITGPTQVCPFSSITLSDVIGGGTWTASNGNATVVSTSGVVTGQTAGTVTITYTINTGCDVTYVVTVNPAPVPVITPVGDTIFCPGSFVALTANTGAGLTYQWYDGGVALGGFVSSSYIATTGGSYQVLETNSFGCSTFSTPMSVTVATVTATVSPTDTTVCSGISVTLDANLGIGLTYQWVQGGVAISGAVGSTYTTTAGGTYSVIVTNSTGCSATSGGSTIHLSPAPVANVSLSGPLTFCQGDSVVIKADTAGYSYQWYNSSGAIIGATNQTYTAKTTNTYYLVASNSYSCSATSIVMSVVSNALPNVGITASGATVFCSGGSVTLSATAVAGYTYQWYDGSTAIAGATTSSYLVTTGGAYEVQITNPVTGCTARTLADTSVTVVATPVIVPVTPASFCWGGSALLSTSVSGAGTITYQWYLNGVAITGATGPTYDATIPGNYSCKISIPGSCTATTVAIPVTEYPLPNPVVTFNGTYFQTGTYYVSYQWYKNLVLIPGATTYSTLATGSGDYKVAVTDTNGCQSYADPYVYTTGTTGVGNVNVSNGVIKIYPNPAQTQVHIESAAQVRAVINGIDGRGILNIADAKDIDISMLSDGIYMILLYDSNGIMLKAEKLVKAAN